MEAGAKLPDTAQRRRGPLVTAVARWISWGMGVLSLAFVADAPGVRPRAAVAVLATYAAFDVAATFWQRRRGRKRGLQVLHDVLDALTVGAGAAVSGGLDSPIWLLLYPHVVSVSVRGGLAYAMAMGVLDALVVALLTALTPAQPTGVLHAVAILFCAFMGGSTSSYLKKIRQRLSEANQELSEKNARLSDLVAAHEKGRGEQEHALSQLRASEERYRRLLERIQDGVLIIQDGKIVYANESLAAMAGAGGDLRGLDFLELAPPQDRKEMLERYRRWEESQAAAGGFEARLLTRAGQVVLASVKAGSVEFEGRRSVIATVRDITRERRMEQEVKAHAARLAAINEIANAVNLSLTIEDIFAVAAEEARKLVSFDRLTIALEAPGPGLELVAVAHGVERTRPAWSRSEVSWAFRRPTLWSKGEPEPGRAGELLAEPRVQAILTVPLASKDRVIGSLNLGRLKGEPFSAADLAVMEPVARHMAIALDNARLLEAVRRRGREFESLLEITRGILERLEPKDILPLVTHSVNEIMGTQYCLLLLRSGEDLVVGAQEGLEPEVVAAFKGLRVGDSLSGWVARQGEPLALHEMRQDARLRFAEMVDQYGYRSYLGVPLRRGRDVIGTLEVVTKEVRHFTAEEQELMGAFADQAAVAIENARLFDQARVHLSELAQANRRLEDLDRLRREYLRNVSHEFRTPLTVIKGYAEFLLDSEDPSLRGIMRIVVESCDRVIDMVDTLIEVSRIEQGAAEQTLQMQTLDLRDVAATSLEPLRLGAEKKGIVVSTEFPPQPLKLQADQGLLVQVVRKLVDNAVKYSPPGARVVVRAQAEGDELCLEVEDFGVGISSEHLPRIFEKFYMVDGGITRRTGGTGVGLYLVREIVKLHGGTIGVRSLPGTGSVFTVRLPRQLQGARQAALA